MIDNSILVEDLYSLIFMYAVLSLCEHMY